jgi:hypothetical protein
MPVDPDRVAAVAFGVDIDVFSAVAGGDHVEKSAFGADDRDASVVLGQQIFQRRRGSVLS